MNVQEEIRQYLASQSDTKRKDMEVLHKLVMDIKPECKLWFLDGRDSNNKTVSNPNIGYGIQNIKYAGGKTREFYQVGLSANTAGISVYIMGIADKTYLARMYAQKIGKASVTGYCIKFKALADVDAEILKAAITDGFNAQKAKD
jgi:hypothetical protein